jgi:hypothetical protein
VFNNIDSSTFLEFEEKDKIGRQKLIPEKEFKEKL